MPANPLFLATALLAAATVVWLLHAQPVSWPGEILPEPSRNITGNSGLWHCEDPYDPFFDEDLLHPSTIRTWGPHRA
jgi:hypothetical protein